MAFREDPDLTFLKNCSDEELKNLADILIYDADGTKRLTSSLSSEPRYKEAEKTGHYTAAWREIAAEYQLFGGDTLINILRGEKGVTYREILKDLCRSLKIDFKKKETTVNIEKHFMMELLRQSLQGMSPENRKKFLQSNNLMADVNDLHNFSMPAVTTALMLLFRTGGVMARRVLLVLVNTVMKSLLGRSLTIATSQTLLRSAALFSGPVGWTLNIALFLPVFTGPNKKVTLVATLYIAALRRSHLLNKTKNKKALTDKITKGKTAATEEKRPEKPVFLPPAPAADDDEDDEEYVFIDETQDEEETDPDEDVETEEERPMPEAPVRARPSFPPAAPKPTPLPVPAARDLPPHPSKPPAPPLPRNDGGLDDLWGNDTASLRRAPPQIMTPPVHPPRPPITRKTLDEPRPPDPKRRKP